MLLRPARHLYRARSGWHPCPICVSAQKMADLSIGSAAIGSEKVSVALHYSPLMETPASISDSIPTPSKKEDEVTETADLVARAHRNDVTTIPLQILLQTGGLVAVNKPFDVRMNGDFDVTLEKLVNSRIPRVDESRAYHECHRLDYATSGVNIYAGTQQSASAVQTLFQERHVKKWYLALLKGHITSVPSKPGTIAIPTIREALKSVNTDRKVLFDSPLDGFAHDFAATARLREKPRTHALATPRNSRHWFDFIKKNFDVRKTSDDGCGGTPHDEFYSMKWDDFKALANSKRPAGTVPPVEGDFIKLLEHQPLSPAEDAISTPVLQELFADADWATRIFDFLVSLAAQDLRVYRDARRAVVFADKTTTSVPQACMPAASASVPKETAADVDIPLPEFWDRPRFSISAPIADIETEFRMCIDPIGKVCSLLLLFGRQHQIPPSRYCLQTSTTLVQVLGYGRFKSHDVTKVLFYPVTGRRHQLRLHSQYAGHPIVGDATYGSHDDADRMMLHAWRIAIDVSKHSRYRKTWFGAPHRLCEVLPPSISAAAPDPFVPRAQHMEGLALDLVETADELISGGTEVESAS